MDYRLNPWLELSGEAFAFGKSSLPNIRATATLYPFFDPRSFKPWNWLYLQGGINSALDNSARDYFLGGGLRFADEEARGLVGLVPLAGN
ncbi:hypothetical protein MASR2M78_13980 [Treponema sp.]